MTYWMRWEKQRELAWMMPDLDENMQCIVQNYEKYNGDTRAEKMSINDCAHVWKVYGTELQEKLDWNKDIDSDYDDIMQQ